ncbi:MAG: hypothetical protein J6Z11_01030 [Candidatus Riflebacteria bacterium]|nr:hypothetical protein [Candidatus Riflebacteria bacterium]
MKLSSQQTSIVVYTNHLKVQGKINFDEATRLTDVLNSKSFNKDFLAINDATITELKTGESINVSFLSLNKNNIEVIYEER